MAQNKLADYHREHLGNDKKPANKNDILFVLFIYWLYLREYMK